MGDGNHKHKWIYYEAEGAPENEIRVCKKCKFNEMKIADSGWFDPTHQKFSAIVEDGEVKSLSIIYN